ncbi:dystonin-like isoform X38 [Amphibalanus amphitrite]|uniref:dystonin-like isoform X38 n=1 Tax=Amphibalanus amphitrite TaxID=1232801 RepID=UPI001C925CA7|nr:dystonin-like isoform X38 [Amphibalanus amphitrite]
MAQRWKKIVRQLADERDAIQKKTFTKWVNKHLKKCGRNVRDLFVDLRDGKNLLGLLEVLSGERLPSQKGQLRFHQLQNVQVALDFLHFRKIKLVNIRPEDIVDGNPKLTLGLIWTIILHFQISDIVEGDDTMSAKEALLRWAQRTTERYPGVNVRNFTSSWRDGLAFNAIIHRNRPDLVDWRELQHKSARTRLDQAFTLMDTEYGVTRLLDPEDVDTPEPDEKSVLTYVSSLYDIFPQPPAEHPLYDAVSSSSDLRTTSTTNSTSIGTSTDLFATGTNRESQRTQTEYRESATRLSQWLRQTTSRLQDRTLPASLVELRHLLTEAKMFRTHDVPPRQQELRRVTELYQQLQRQEPSFAAGLEPELQGPVLEHSWSLMQQSLQERQQLIEEEIATMERLQRLADKVLRETRATDRRLDSILQRIRDEAKRSARLKPAEVKQHCEKIDEELVQIEETIKSLFSDVNTLQDGRQPQAGELYRGVKELHDKWMSVHTTMQDTLLLPLSRRSAEDPETMLRRLVETDENFRFLQECLEWVKEKLERIHEAEYGHDLQTCQHELDAHHKEHKVIDQFQVNLDRCVAAKNNYDHEELTLYMRLLSQLQKTYADLLSTSNKRLSDLMILHDFIQGATNELIWLNEKEEAEVGRDWSDRHLDLRQVEAHYEHLMGELERRERQFNAVQEQGGSLVSQHHPAGSTVEAYLAAMQTQWSWILQLTLCLETHLKHAQLSHKLFKDVEDMTRVINQQDDRLNSEFSRSEFTLDDGEQLLRDMQLLRDAMAQQAEEIERLERRAQQATPLRQRRHPDTGVRLTTICNYKNANLSLRKQDTCTLVDGSHRFKWVVRTAAGQEGEAPSVCFLLPPPDKDAAEAVEKLKRLYEMSIMLWQRKQLRMRQNMIFATIKVVKSWDLQQFMGMGKEQRDAIRRALNEDAGKLIQEGDPSDGQLRRLRREIDEVNALFEEFERLAADADPTNQFNTRISSLEVELETAERQLTERCRADIPRRQAELERLVVDHKDWENRLERHETVLEEVTTIYDSLSKKTPTMKNKLDNVQNKWDSLWKTSSMYIERMKCVELALSGLEEASGAVSELEMKLSDHRRLPDDREGLRSAHLSLVDIKNSLQKHQTTIEQLTTDVAKTRTATERTRPRQRNHADIEKLEDDVNKLNRRWTTSCEAVLDRLRAVDQAADLLSQYEQQEQMERQWASQMESEARQRELELERARQAVIEKYRHCDDSIAKLLDWVERMERRVANQERIQEDVSNLRNQINVVRAIKDELKDQQRPVSSVLDQVQDVTEKGGDVLSKDETKQLDKNARELRQRYDTVVDRTEQLLRRLTSCLDELSKYRTDLVTFQTWLSSASRTLVDKERLLSDLNKLKANEQTCKDFVNDVIAHQADLRFITVAAQKFIDESKEYLKTLNEFRTSLPQRLGHIEPHEYLVKQEVAEVTQTFQDLLSRANKLADKLSSIGSRQREYQEALERAERWLREAEPRAEKVVNEPVAAEPRGVQEQLDRARTLSTDVLAQGKLFDNATLSAAQLVKSLEGQIGPKESERISRPPEELADKYRRLSDAVTDRCQALDMALVQSQGVQDGLDSLMTWLTQAETRLKGILKPASLNRERLTEQLQEQRVLQADIDQHQASVEQIQRSAEDLLQTPSNARIAKKIEQKLTDLTTRFYKLRTKCHERGVLLDEVSSQLDTFWTKTERLDQWFVEVFELVESNETSKLNVEAYTAKVDEISRQAEAQRPEYQAVVNTGHGLVTKKDVTDTAITKEKVKELEGQWAELQELLDERLREGRTRSDSLSAYERLREDVLTWLTRMESSIDSLQPVAVDQDLLKKQSDELKPLIREHTSYFTTIEKVHELGTQYDSLLRGRGETPARRRSSVTPAKRASVSHGRRSVASPLSSARKASYDLRGSSPARSPFVTGDGFFNIDDMSPIQAQLTEIDNRYQMAGTRLTDRQADIENVTDEVRRHADTLKKLQQFLDKSEAKLPRDSAVQTRDEADKQLGAVRALTEELYERQPSLDGLRTQAGELLRRRPGVPGADRLQDDLTEVVDRWRQLQDNLKRRQKQLQDSRQFFDTHDQLASWLKAKEKMLTVLGPLSSDPRLVQMQSQQVAVLRDEFAGQYPNLQTLNKVGQSLVDEAEPQTADSVDKKMRQVNDKWEELISQLEEREQTLDAASGTSRRFNDELGKLQRELQKITDNVDDLSAEKTEPSQKLTKLDKIQYQVEELKPRLSELETLGDELCNVLTDASAKAEVKDKLYQLGRQQTQLQRKLDNLRAELESSLKEDREFENDCAGVQEWIKDCVEQLGRPLKVSADEQKLARQVEDYEPVYKNVMAREHEVFLVQKKGKDLIAKTTNKQEAKNLEKFLERLQKDWENLKKDAVNRQTRLRTCTDHCRKYHSTLERFVPWLDSSEIRLERLQPISFHRSEIQKQLREIQAFKNEVSLRSGEHEQTQSTGETLLSATDTDKEGVQADLTDLRRRWDALQRAVAQRQANLDDVLTKVTDFTDRLRDVDRSLQRAEDKLASHDALGGGRDPRLLERVADMVREAEQLAHQLDKVRNQADDLCDEARHVGSDASHIKDEVDRVGDRLNNLQAKLDDRHGDLKSASHAVGEVNDRIKELHSQLGALEEELDGMAPVAREVKIVERQVTEITIFLEKVVREKTELVDAERTVDGLVQEGFTTDAKTLRDQLGSMKRQLSRIEDRGQAREQEVQLVLTKLTTFYRTYEVVVGEIEQVSADEAALSPPATDVATIRRQQQEFREFKTTRVETLSVRVDEINKTGQGLVQTAAAGVKTALLEGDLEKMNDLWNELKERMHNRERALDVGLLQSGKFREALEGLLQWLADTEDLVANQRPPSADYKVVKAQVQEQRFLQKLLLDRQGSVSSLSDMGREMAKKCSPAEKADIEEQLRELIRRFDALNDQAADRMGRLEDAMKVAKEYQDANNPLVQWLEKMQRKLKDMETIPTDEEKIQRKIQEHDELHAEIVDRRGAFDDLKRVGKKLAGLVGDEEATALSERLRDVTDQYERLVDDSETLARLLRQAGTQLRSLVLNYEDFLAWMDETQQKLNKYKVLSVHVDKLHEQLEELTWLHTTIDVHQFELLRLKEAAEELSEDVDRHREPERELQDIGAELMKHISSDEALQLKDKLDSVSHRYQDLESKASSLLKSAQEVLPLVHAFHKAHNELTEWLVSAEQTLQTVDSQHNAEQLMETLEKEVSQHRGLLDQVNQAGPQLSQISPGDGAQTIESLVTRDNRRFEAIAEQVQRKAERLRQARQRHGEVVLDIDELLDWFKQVEKQLRTAELPGSEPAAIREQLKEARALSDDISGQKGRVRDVLSAAKKLVRDAAQYDDVSEIREKADQLRDTSDTVSKLSADRVSVLEQALPLAEHFNESHSELSEWLDEAENEAMRLDVPALRPDQILRQQDKNKTLLQSVTERKPLLDKLNKTGAALARLVTDEDSSKVSDLMETDNVRYNALRTALRERQQALEEALQECSQFADKLDGMLSALKDTADQVDRAEPISAHPDRIHDQMAENNAIIDDLEKRASAFDAVKKAAADVIGKAGKGDPAVKDIKKKLDSLNTLWDHLQSATNDRGRSLDEALAISEKFWSELQGVMRALKELQETLSSQEPPAIEPSAIKEQQKELQEIRQELDQAKPEVDQVRRTGHDLMKVCGEPEKPDVKKNLADLDSAWDNITALYARREENLIDAMEKAMAFHETMQSLMEFLEDAEDRLGYLGPVGSDIDAIKKQIKQLMDFKNDVDPQMVKVESLNRSIRRQAQELMERTSPDQAAALQQPLADINTRWDDLLKGIVERQRELDHALLRLGQFQHALDELLVWIGRTDKTLDGLRPVFGDPQVIEVELAKLKVSVNDIQAHQTSVDTLNDAGRQLIETDSESADASTTNRKLRQLNERWSELQEKAGGKQRDLEAALKDAQDFMTEIQDLLFWLNDLDGALTTSKPVGGLPETAKEQLERFMELFAELEENRSKVDSALTRGDAYLKKSKEGACTNLKHNLKTLKQRWEHVMNRANDKKIKLEIALKEATEFQEALQEFVDWLTNAEGVLTNLKPASRVMDNIVVQIDEHKDFQKEVSAHRETMLNLEKKGTQLKYFSQKQDVILIKNMLSSVQHRWERVVSKSAERTRALDLGYKEAKEFHDSWSELCGWLEEALFSLEEAEASLSNSPDKIRALLDKHKEFQRALGGKQSAYDQVMKLGRLLVKEKAPKEEEPILRGMMDELKDKWNTCCNKSVERQRKLEEALLFSGQFKEAITALLDWLRKVDAQLDEKAPVHGDLDTVTNLVEQHRTLEEELAGRAQQVESIQKTGQELLESADKKDAAVIKTQVTELTTTWTSVIRASDGRSQRLQQALADAETLHRDVHGLLEYLSDTEQKLRFVGALPATEEEAQQQADEHGRLMDELHRREGDKDATLRLAAQILEKAHPDAVPVIKHWQTIIESRWEEVSSWALQRQQRLAEHLASLKDLQELLDELLRWVRQRENKMIELEPVPLPEERPEIEVLIQEHQEFMEDLQSRQPDVDAICKPKHKGLRKGSRAKSPSPTRPLQNIVRRLSQFSPDREGSPGKKSQGSPERDISPTRDYDKPWLTNARASPERSSDHPWPRIGPVFHHEGSPAPGGRKSSRAMSEPVLKTPRQRELWDAWRNTWLMAWERQRRLQDKYNYSQEMEKLQDFDFEEWRKRFMKYANVKKMRITDLFRKMDTDNDTFLGKDEFIDGMTKTNFPTTTMELQIAANCIDKNQDGLIDYNEFMAALRPDWEKNRPLTEGEKIDDEVKKICATCACRTKFKVFQVGEGKYRFGDSQKLRLVRILRSTVMVRVGGGWEALDEFLIKNDPCREVCVSRQLLVKEHHERGCPMNEQPKGRTNVELREQFVLAPGVSQSMTPFKSKKSSVDSRSGSVPTTGVVTKVREKTGRSTPLGRASVSSAAGDRAGSVESGHRHLRKGSTPVRSASSQGGSKPPSRAGSEISLDSTDGRVQRTPGSRLSTGRKSSTPSGKTSSPAANGSANGKTYRFRRPASVSSFSPGVPTPSRSRIPVMVRSGTADEIELSDTRRSLVTPPTRRAISRGGSTHNIPEDELFNWRDMTPRSRASSQSSVSSASRLSTGLRPKTSGSQIPVPTMQREGSASKIHRRSSAASDSGRGQTRKSTSSQPRWH